MLAQELTMSGKSACEAEIMYCHPVGLLQGCCGRAAALCLMQLLWWKSRINKDNKVPGISHSLGVCDMVDIQDLH